MRRLQHPESTDPIELSLRVTLEPWLIESVARRIAANIQDGLSALASSCASVSEVRSCNTGNNRSGTSVRDVQAIDERGVDLQATDKTAAAELRERLGTDAKDEPARPFLIKSNDAAALLSISPRLLWSLDASGQIPQPVRLGRSVRWNVDVLRHWIEVGCPSRECFERATKSRTKR